jgi:hypothetical protein
MNRRNAAFVAATLGAALAAAPAQATDSVAGSTCRLVADPTETRLDVAAFYVVGGPLVVANPSVTSVTVTCRIVIDGETGGPVASATHSGQVGYAAGHFTTATLFGPSISVCTQVGWTGGTAGSYDDCGT